MTPIWQLFVSGAVGSSLTYVFTFLRERKRMEDAYRTPQRHAIGEILAAGHELQLRQLEWRNAMTDLSDAIQQERAESMPALSAELQEVGRAQATAMLDLRRALEISHLTVVDAPCWESMVAVALAFEQFQTILNEKTPRSSPDDFRLLVAQLEAQSEKLRVATSNLVRTANDRVTPVEGRGNRRRRRESQRRLTAWLEARHDMLPPTQD